MKKNKNDRAVKFTASSKKYKPQRKKTEKNVSLRNNILKKILIIIFIFAISIIFIFVSGIFNISEIIVENNKLVSSEQVISFSKIEIGKNIFSISKKNVINNLKENSYINAVEIKRVFPNKIKLIIDERNIDYVLQFASSYVYINNQGYILQISNEKPNVPIILGVSTDLNNIKTGDRLVNDDLIKMNIVIKIMENASTHGIFNLITKIDISNPENYVLYMDTISKIVYIGDGSDLNTRFLYINAILKDNEGKSGIIFVDKNLNSEYPYFRENI